MFDLTPPVRDHTRSDEPACAKLPIAYRQRALGIRGRRQAGAEDIPTRHWTDARRAPYRSTDPTARDANEL
jgi:hypothetical protein